MILERYAIDKRWFFNYQIRKYSEHLAIFNCFIFVSPNHWLVNFIIICLLHAYDIGCDWTGRASNARAASFYICIFEHMQILYLIFNITEWYRARTAGERTFLFGNKYLCVIHKRDVPINLENIHINVMWQRTNACACALEFKMLHLNKFDIICLI